MTFNSSAFARASAAFRPRFLGGKSLLEGVVALGLADAGPPPPPDVIALAMASMAPEHLVMSTFEGESFLLKSKPSLVDVVLNAANFFLPRSRAFLPLSVFSFASEGCFPFPFDEDPILSLQPRGVQ